MNTPESITVRALKYDGKEHRRWSATIARREGPLIVLDAKFEEAVHHAAFGEIPSGTRTIEYYWLDRWFNIFQFLNDDGDTRLFYCNVGAPATMDGQFLNYLDLDIDILVHADLSYQVLDLDEFESNATRWSYSDETRRQASSAVTRLISMIESREFPFS
jgi:protein associated with RNAse G/E